MICQHIPGQKVKPLYAMIQRGRRHIAIGRVAQTVVKNAVIPIPISFLFKSLHTMPSPAGEGMV